MSDKTVNDVESPLLSICIPTFNRHHNLLRQLEFLKSEVDGISDIEVIVSDNCSTDDTAGVTARFSDVFAINRNTENIGAVRNIVTLSQLAKGKFIWFIGDDDLLDAGIVRKVIAVLRERPPSFLFINHRTIDAQERTLHEQVIPRQGREFYASGASFIDEIPAALIGQLMFITACVYEKSRISTIVRDGPIILAIPLHFSLCCANGPRGVSVIRELGVSNYWGDTSWSDQAELVSCRQVPAALATAVHYGYPSVWTVRLVLRYVRGHWGGIWRYYLRPLVKLKRRFIPVAHQ